MLVVMKNWCGKTCFRMKLSMAYFLGLKNSALSPAEGIMDCETDLRTQNMEPDVVVLGMGDDGHTASWFPGSQQLPSFSQILKIPLGVFQWKMSF